MFSVCLIFEPNETEWYNQWSYVLSHWNPDRVYVIGEDEVNTAYENFTSAIGINSADDLPNDVLVLLQPSTAKFVKPTESILEFEHPENCIYMFGRDHGSVTGDDLGDRIPDYIVSIPSDEELEMFSWVAGAVTFYDRRLKQWQTK